MSAKQDDMLIRPVVPLFAYMGNKYRCLPHIMQHLPYRITFVDVFGGSGSVCFNRMPGGVEVYNDINGDVVNFYRCVRDKKLLEALCDFLELTVQSREEWLLMQPTRSIGTEVERAAKWYYSMVYSFGGFGKVFGREMRNVRAGRVNRKLKEFSYFHMRLQRIVFEQLSWYQIMRDYDNKETVFYCDPPYFAAGHKYIQGMSEADHKELLDTIFTRKGFVAISGYANPLYDDSKYPWTKRITYQIDDQLGCNALMQAHKGSGADPLTEVLWVKD